MGRPFAPVGLHVQRLAVVELPSAMEGDIKTTGRGNSGIITIGKKISTLGGEIG